jgi:hypothetical protein
LLVWEFIPHEQLYSLTSTPRPSLSLLAFAGAGAGSAPSSGGFEAVLLRGGMVRSRSEGNRYSAGLYCNDSESRGDGDSMAVVKWQVIAEHVKRRVNRVEVQDEARWMETLKWCRPFQNSTSRLRPGLPCLSPTAHSGGQPSKSGEHYSWAIQLQAFDIILVMVTYIVIHA